MEHKPQKGQENKLVHQEIGGDLENVRDTLVPHDDGGGADLVEQRDSLLPRDNDAPEAEE